MMFEKGQIWNPTSTAKPKQIARISPKKNTIYVYTYPKRDDFVISNAMSFEKFKEWISKHGAVLQIDNLQK